MALPAPRSLLSISRRPQSLSTTSLTGHFTDMHLSGEPSAQQTPRSLLSISLQPQNLSMTSITGRLDDMRLLEETPIAPLQCEGAAVSSSEVQKEDTTQLILWCSRKGNGQCDWHFFYRSGTPWSVIARIVSGHHHFCPMPPYVSEILVMSIVANTAVVVLIHSPVHRPPLLQERPNLYLSHVDLIPSKGCALPRLARRSRKKHLPKIPYKSFRIYGLYLSVQSS